MQVASRIFLTWGVCLTLLRKEVATSKVYFLMVLCWSLAESVRFIYYLFTARNNRVPKNVIWCRYNFFLILYPVGAFCEAILIKRSIPQIPIYLSPLKKLYKILLMAYTPRKCFKAWPPHYC